MAEKEEKYIVIKRDDLAKYVTAHGHKHFDEIIELIQKERSIDGKNPINSYLVINLDEPYAEPMWQILLAFETLKEQLSKPKGSD